MLSLKLPQLEEGLESKITDVKSCKQWLAVLPLANAPAAHKEITQQLKQLNQIKIPLLERLKVAEQLREPVAFMQEALAKKYLGKPLPFGAAEQDGWDKVCALWQAMGEAYLHCLQGVLDGDPEVSEHAALITHRCLRYISHLMLAHYHAYRQIEGELWHQLHTLYAYAEEQGYARKPVKDSLNEMAEATTCSAVYAQVLLTNLANPYQFSYKQLELLDRWLDKWGARVPLSVDCPKQSAISIILSDLESSVGPGVLNEASPPRNPRYLDTERLAGGVRKRIKFLRKGGSPAELDIGEECSQQPGCEVFFTTLYKQWCEVPVSRSCERRTSFAMAQACFGMPTLHFFISGEKPFEQPDKSHSLDWQEMQDIQMFGRKSERTEKLRIAQLGHSLETWKIQDESALGFCLTRPVSENFQISHNQLVALRPDDSSQFVLGAVRWLTLTLAGDMQVGVRTILGTPITIGVRPVVLNVAEQAKFVQALLLPEVPALQTSSSLVLPAGIFQPGRLLEIHAETRQTVKLQTLIEKGFDYERASFVNA